MSSSGSQRMISQISQILPISELIDHINLSKGKSHHLNDPQNILREYNTKREIENLTRSRDAVKREVCELDRNLDLAELSNLKLEDDLRKTQRKCDELAKTVTLLTEEKNKKDEKIIELENKNAERERLVGVYLEKCESLDIEIVKMGKEIEGLRRDNVEATKTMEVLRLRKSESDQVAEGYKNRIEKIGKSLADMLNADNWKGSCYSGGRRSSGLSMRAGMKEKGWGLQMCSGAHASGTHPFMSGAGHFSKITCSSSNAGNVIEITDSADEANPDGAADVSNVGENEINFVWSPTSSKGSKRNRPDCIEDNLIVNSTTKREKITRTSDEDIVLIQEKENEAGPASDSQIPVEKCEGVNDEVSTDSCTDSRIGDLVATLKSKKRDRKWMCEGDMLRALQWDEELCMNAVCALYRQQVVARKSKGHPNLSKNEGFSLVDSVSGCALAEYLIGGDKELRLRKSVSEVKKERPDVIGQCRKLATIYVNKLFAIYCAADDPFFGQS